MDNLGQTSLHRAAHCGHLQTCRLLLSSGCDPSIVSLQGFTALQMGNESVQQLLQGTTDLFKMYLGSNVIASFTCYFEFCQGIIVSTNKKKVLLTEGKSWLELFNSHAITTCTWKGPAYRYG